MTESTPTEDQVATWYDNAGYSAQSVARLVRGSAGAALDDVGAQTLAEDLWALDYAVQKGRQKLVLHLRGAGASWAQVGSLLGISRQAAYERFGHLEQPRGE